MKYEVNKEYTRGLALKTEVDHNEPGLFQVVVHNDDFTPIEFVVSVLERFFYLDRRQATAITLQAQAKGKAVCGVFTKDVAESKTHQVIDYARTHEYPLICSTEAAT